MGSNGWIETFHSRVSDSNPEEIPYYRGSTVDLKQFPLRVLKQMKVYLVFVISIPKCEQFMVNCVP